VDAQRQAIVLTDAAPKRAVRRTRLAELLVEVEGWAAAVAQMRVAVDEAEGDPSVRAEALYTLSAVTDDIDLAEASAVEALRLLEALPDPDPALLASALQRVAGTRFHAGYGLDHGMYRRAIE
jgi:hypothetical protein